MSGILYEEISRNLTCEAELSLVTGPPSHLYGRSSDVAVQGTWSPSAQYVNSLMQ